MNWDNPLFNYHCIDYSKYVNSGQLHSVMYWSKNSDNKFDWEWGITESIICVDGCSLPDDESDWTSEDHAFDEMIAYYFDNEKEFKEAHTSTGHNEMYIIKSKELTWD